MIAKKSEKFPTLIDRLRSLEENGLIEPEKVELERNTSPLPLSQRSVVQTQTMLQEDKNSGC